MEIHPNIQEIMETQYYQPGEGPEDMLRRVANFVAGGEKELAEEYFRTMNEGYWLPSSPFLMNAGTETPMLGACFVQGITDDMAGIFETLKRSAMIHKMGGGTGFDFSPLRHRGAPIKSTGGTSSGVLSFLELFNLEGEVVKQGGRRRSANLATLRIDHPEILDFIDAKLDKDRFNNFNFSVGVPDWFMWKVKNDEVYNLIDVEGNVVGTLDARTVFDKIVKNNWEGGEPGILFLDSMNRDNKLLHLGLLTSTNPCGEIALLPDEACNLASINLDRLVTDGEFDLDELADLVKLIIGFLDRSIDLNKFPFPEIEAGVKRTRKLGLGIMGLHGMLIQLGLTYNSEAGRNMACSVLDFIQEIATIESAKLAGEKGVPDGWYGSEWEREGIQIRNLTRICIAPTGTISMICNSSSSGIEPIFSIVYERDIRDTITRWINPLFESIAKSEGWYSDELIDKIIANKGRLTGLFEVPEKWRRLFITAQEISPEDHVLMQASLQKFVDNSISKTINIPEDTPIREVRNIYMMAWQLGCKGLTIYREGSRSGVLTNISIGDNVHDPITGRPDMLIGVTTKIRSGCGKLWITINPYKGKPWEVFASTGADGGCTSNIEEIARLASLLFREGVDIEKVLDQLRSVKCAHAVASKCGVNSCSDAIAKELMRFMKIYKPDEWNEFFEKVTGQKVPNVVSKDLGKEINKETDMPDFLREINSLSGCRGGSCS